MAKPQRTVPNRVIVVGGGPVGLTAALALADAGVAVTVMDPDQEAMTDRRTAALMAASVVMLERLGVWRACRDAAAPLRRLRLIDDTGRLIRAPTVEFDAAEIGEAAFGWNVPHQALLPAMRAACTASPLIERLTGTVERILTEEDRVTVRLDSGREIAARLLVGADGRASLARRVAGIRVDEWRYDQAALVANLRHGKPHEETSTEFHRTAGPFTLVPLPGQGSSLVWVESRAVAEALASFRPADLAREIERLSRRLLGSVEVDGPVAVFPLSGLTARRFAARRIALVGEAAHVIPPIGAQGLNLGLRDAAALADIVGEATRLGADPGGAAVTSGYDRSRYPDVASRTGAVDLLNRSLVSSLLPIQLARATGLAALSAIAPLRRAFMREGVAPRLALPGLMRREAG